jgi:two-component system, LytTR family, response regulator
MKEHGIKTGLFRCLLVDPDERARDVLRRHIDAFALLEPVGECADAAGAFQFLLNNPVDLLFLDISRPNSGMLDFLRALRNPPKTIVTSENNTFALDGYELDVADFLLKPIGYERFLKAIQKAFRHTPLPPPAAASPDPEPFLYFRAERKMVKVLLRDILYIESQKDYVRIVTKNNPVVTKQPISAVAATLPPQRFFRIHRSFIVNLQYVSAYKTTSAQVGEQELPVGRLYKEAWVERMRSVG